MTDELKQGSPAWRDAQDQQLEALVSDPDKWVFYPTEQQKAIVLSSYEAVASELRTGVPDTYQVRLMIAQCLPEDTSLIGFWQAFCSDMPAVMQRQMFTLEPAWSEFKIQHILTELKRPFIEWDAKEIVLVYKSPESLREVANLLEVNEADGFSLYDIQVDEARSTIKYQIRRPNLVKFEEEPKS